MVTRPISANLLKLSKPRNVYESVLSQEKDPFKLFPDFKGLLLADCNSFILNHIPPSQIENLLTLTKTILATSSSEEKLL
jgi:hypothetical protein